MNQGSKEKNIEGFFTRHAQAKGEKMSKDYPSLTEKGVEQAENVAQTEILELIKNAPEGAVIFIGASSDQKRTAETGQVYGDTLNEMIYDQKIDPEIEVVTKENIEELTKAEVKKKTKEEAKTETKESLAKIEERIKQTPPIDNVLTQIEEYLKNEDPDKKIVINFPIQLKGFSYGFRDRWTKEGKKTEYFKAVVEKHGGDHGPAGLEWLQNQTIIGAEGKEIKGPDPTEVAKEYLESFRRLQEFATKHTDRPIIMGGVGHQWDLDALVTYLASGEKEVTFEKFEEVAGEADRLIMNEAEMFRFKIDNQGIVLHYRGKDWKIEAEAE